MKKNFYRYISYMAFLFAGLCICTSSFSQVTIGTNVKPLTGALLDLKEKDDATGGATSDKGLLLPRVKLNTLKPEAGKLSESIGNTGTWTESVHTGLLVYNATNTLDACTGGTYQGVYIWSGAEWLPLFQNKISTPTTDVTTDTYGGANSYIVAPEGTVIIPVQRAFDIWAAFTGTTPVTGKVLDPTTAIGSLSGALTAKIIWQDAGSVTNATISGTGSAANLTVTAGTTAGNALVQVLIGGKVLWQWHIWVTSDDPHQNAEIYRVNGVDNWYMNSFLGAKSSSEAGLYYQWGRSVPMQKTGGVVLIDATTTEKDNLTNAIQSENFIVYADLASQDWYTSIANQWDSRWNTKDGSTAGKSPFDPCPYGWKIPSAVGTDKPWECADQTQNTQVGFTSVLNGYRSNGDGSLGDVGTAGYVWTADANGKMANMLYYKGAVKNNADAFNRANAMNVRCIKEK